MQGQADIITDKIKYTFALYTDSQAFCCTKDRLALSCLSLTTKHRFLVFSDSNGTSSVRIFINTCNRCSIHILCNSATCLYCFTNNLKVFLILRKYKPDHFYTALYQN